VRHKANVQTDRIHFEQAGEVGNLLHFRQARCPRLTWHQAYSADHRRYISVALALEAAEDNRDFHAQVVEPLQKPLGVFRGAGRFVRRMQLNGRHA
jgi:hypothetical protein